MTKHGLGWGHDAEKLGVTMAKTGGAMMPKNSAPKWSHDPG